MRNSSHQSDRCAATLNRPLRIRPSISATPASVEYPPLACVAWLGSINSPPAGTAAQHRFAFGPSLPLMRRVGGQADSLLLLGKVLRVLETHANHAAVWRVPI